MKAGIIGSTQYMQKFLDLKERLIGEGHEVQIPAFDHHPDLDELGVCEHNRNMIEWADKVYIIWDKRSMGTIFDLGMVFALKKPLVIEYLEPKTFENFIGKYSHTTQTKETGK